MKRGIQLTILIAVALVLLSACSQQAEIGTETNTNTEEITEVSSEEFNDIIEEETTEEISSDETIEISSSGFSPSTLTITKGTTVKFINMDEGGHWPASASHPTHTAYPTEGGCIGSSFDACKALAQGETFEFTFDEVGEWKYHDHRNPSLFGTIIVEE